MTGNTDLAVDASVGLATWMVRSWAQRLRELTSKVAAPGYTADDLVGDASALVLLAAGSGMSFAATMVSVVELIGAEGKAEPRPTSEWHYITYITQAPTGPVELRLAAPLQMEEPEPDTDPELNEIPAERVVFPAQYLDPPTRGFRFEVSLTPNQAMEGGLYVGNVEACAPGDGTVIGSAAVSIAV